MSQPSRKQSPKTPKAVLWRQGVHVAGSALWCDALRAHELCFVSSALALGKSRKRAGTLLCTPTTLQLLTAMGRAPQGPQLLSPLRRPFFWGTLRLELFASGSDPGAASLWVKLPSEERVIFAGLPSELATSVVEPLQVRQADSLVIAAPSAPLYVELPSQAALIEQILSSLSESRSRGVPLIVRCSSLILLAELLPKLKLPCVKLSVELHRALTFCQTLPGFPTIQTVSARAAKPGQLLFWPTTSPLPKLPDDSLLLTLPDGLSLSGLVRYARASGVRHVYLTAGFEPSVAAKLAAHKIVAEPIGPPEQLGLFASASSSLL